MTLLGIIITLLIGAAVGYFFAIATRDNRVEEDRDHDGRKRSKMVMKRPAVNGFGTEVGTIGEQDEEDREGQQVQQQTTGQSPVKPAYSSAKTFLDNRATIDANAQKQQSFTSETGTIGQTESAKDAQESAQVLAQKTENNQPNQQ